MKYLTQKVLSAIKDSPRGIAMLDVLKSLKLSGALTLKTTLSRLSKSNRIIRLKRGVYATNPLHDAFAAAQATFGGYIGFSSALYLHELITESPFEIMVVTTSKSRLKNFGAYTFRSVVLGEKAIGFEDMAGIAVSTKAKTLFDCLYLEQYSIEHDKLIAAYRDARLSIKELKEFDSYVARFIPSSRQYKFDKARAQIKQVV